MGMCHHFHFPCSFSESILLIVWPQTLLSVQCQVLSQVGRLLALSRSLEGRAGSLPGSLFLASQVATEAKPPGAEDPLVSHQTGLDLFKEGAESAQVASVITQFSLGTVATADPHSHPVSTRLRAWQPGLVDSDLFSFRS